MNILDPVFLDVVRIKERLPKQAFLSNSNSVYYIVVKLGFKGEQQLQRQISL